MPVHVPVIRLALDRPSRRLGIIPYRALVPRLWGQMVLENGLGLALDWPGLALDWPGLECNGQNW